MWNLSKCWDWGNWSPLNWNKNFITLKIPNFLKGSMFKAQKAFALWLILGNPIKRRIAFFILKEVSLSWIGLGVLFDSKKFVVRFRFHWRQREGFHFHRRGLKCHSFQFETLRFLIFNPPWRDSDFFLEGLYFHWRDSGIFLGGFIILLEGFRYLSRGFIIPLEGFSYLSRGIIILLEGFRYLSRGFIILLEGFRYLSNRFITPLKGFRFPTKGFIIPLEGFRYPSRGFIIS